MAIVKTTSGQDFQQIFGAIDPNGNKISGEGFRSRKIKEGTYIIEFEIPFLSNPAPVCTIAGPEWTTFNVSIAIVDVSTEYFICVVSEPNCPIDCYVNFIVSGNL